jgi:hypothetical protein
MHRVVDAMNVIGSRRATVTSSRPFRTELDSLT